MDINDHKEAEFEQIYECQDCKAIQEESKLVSVKLNGGNTVYYKLRCCQCNSENVKCIGDNLHEN